MKKRGNLIVLSGPSGVGKSTLIKRVREVYPDLRFSVSCTTRQPRANEVDGKDYYFVSAEEFQKKVQNGEFLEHATVFSNSYGTLKSEVLRHIENGLDVLLDIDTQGTRQIQTAIENDEELKSSTVFVLIAPPSLAELSQRLINRSTESEEQLKLRIASARNELKQFRLYDFVVVNDDIEVASRQLTRLLEVISLRASLIVGDLFDE